MRGVKEKKKKKTLKEVAILTVDIDGADWLVNSVEAKKG